MAIHHPEEPTAESMVWGENPSPIVDANYSESIGLQELGTLLELPSHITEYQVNSVHRMSLKDPEVTATGAHIYQELCTFYDTFGHKVIREATIAVPNSNLVETIPNVVASSDPWTTGPKGLNRIKIKALVDMGYPVMWLHHADERSPLQKNKSVTRSARQMHAALDDIGDNADFSVSDVIADGYSRAGMTAEKFIALSGQHNRKVMFSILDAACFAVDMSRREKVETLIKQVPKEAKGLGSIAVRHFLHGLSEGTLSTLPEFAKTLNLHPKNIIHEALWAHALINANVAQIIKHQPKDTKGIRNFFEWDYMSQMSAYIDVYSSLPGIVVDAHDGAHVEGASPQYIYEVRKAQFSRLGQAILSGESLDATLILQRAELDLRTLSLVA